MKRALFHTLIWLGLVVLASIWVGNNISVNTDLTEFLPSDNSVVSSIVDKQLNEGPASRSLFITITGKPAKELGSISDEMTRLMIESDHFKTVSNGASLLSGKDRDWTFQNRYLLSPDISAQHFSATSLNTALQTRLQELRSPFPLMPKEYLPADPTAEFMSIINNWSGGNKPTMLKGRFFSKDHQSAIIVAETIIPGWDVNGQEKIITDIESLFASLNVDNKLVSGISGTGYFSVFSKRLIESEARMFSIVATIALIFFLLLMYKSLRYVLLSAIPLLSAVLAGTIAVLLVFSNIHGITLAFGVTILGITIDYPIHAFSHLRNNNRHFWGTIYTGAITTIIAFAVFFYTDITGIAELGLFTLSGLASAVIITRWIIPLWVTSSKQPGPGTLLSHIPPVSHTSRIVTFLLSCCLIVFALTSSKLMWQDDLSVLSPLPDSLLDERNWILEQLGSNDDHRYIIAIQADTLEEVLRQSEQLDVTLGQALNAGVLNHYDLPSRYLPSKQKQEQRQQALPAPKLLQQQLAQAINDLPFKSGIFTPFLQDIEKSRTATLQDLTTLDGPLIKSKLDSLIFEESDKKKDNGWFSIIPVSGVKDVQALKHLVQTQQNDNVMLIDMKTHTSNMVRSFRHTAGERVVIGAVLMLFSLLLSIRNTKRLGRIILSLGVGLLATISLLMLLEIKLSLFHLISLLLVMGIGLDYALFFSLEHKDRSSQKNTLAAVTICAVSTITVFGILAFSQLYVLKAIGLTTTLGVMTIYISTFIFAQPEKKKLPD